MTATASQEAVGTEDQYRENKFMFYISALVAIFGAVGYQYFVKRVPVSLNPIVSVIAMYVAVLALGVILLPLFPADGGLRHHLSLLNGRLDFGPYVTRICWRSH